ncbi:hypothetical protein F2Q69_00034912 [Brassica cretica]|uniref:Uncharacterized protein n=1 Tax=Brassica cretica TaxID=69181 RepID=A0A8S9STP8_BRACR|nr:hypothetical protein F2Q69_00034912 [Brassica cretica]
MQSMVERLPDTPFTDEITLIEMPRKFSFPSIKAYNGTTDPDDHVAQYRQRILVVALPKGSREATMCEQQGPGENLRQPLPNPPASSRTPERLHSPLQSRKAGYLAPNAVSPQLSLLSREAYSRNP